jgi:hypothetical protein
MFGFGESRRRMLKILERRSCLFDRELIWGDRRHGVGLSPRASGPGQGRRGAGGGAAVGHAYSITSSARVSSARGTAMPSVLAVFRLMNNSVLVAR